MTPRVGVIGASGKVGSAITAKARQKGALAFAFARGPLSGGVSDFSDIKFFPEITFIAVPDSAIAEAAGRIILESTANIEGKIFAHCAGSLTIDPLAALKEKGARITATHPYQTFYSPAEDILNGIAWGVECDERDFPEIASALELLDGFAFRLPEGIDKQKYHASAVAASNFATCAIGLGRELARQCDLPVKAFLEPILRRTCENNIRQMESGELPLSGPIARGDAETLARHLASLKNDPELQSAYRDFAAAAQVIYKKFLNQDFQD